MMQVVFVGGAQHIGASCLAIQLADQWIVVDAGVRVDHKADPLPDLALLEGKDVRAIFVTHAHADHIGALPLLHQAFPTVPIFTSRGTALLMEVMLADALSVMTRRAVEEMELPLYPKTLITSMLAQVRSLPLGSCTVPALPGITIVASRAGHIAGAVSLGFVAADGSVVVSGDISLTPQRTVLGAEPPHIDRPDLLILESTYGARLHANRQGEEHRLAQAVAERIARGGSVLIPAFGLGRGQEVILLLRAAQEKGQIPLFPLYVDGLVRRVCSTYLLLPEALSPVLQRQIRKGYAPFTGGGISFVRDDRQRERILAGPPACIVASSGMLTGGPSAWYAERFVERPDAAIFITGYQDEESPGRRFVEVAEHKQTTLALGGRSFSVRCQVATYHLSAHADGSELATYAAVLQPKQIALVHGEQDARLALRTLLAETEVLLPTDGQCLEICTTRAHQTVSLPLAPLLRELPHGIGGGRACEPDDIRQLWQAVNAIPTLRMVTARELADIWYGEVTEETTRRMQEVLASDWDQRYFVPQQALEEAYRVRGQAAEDPGDCLTDLLDKVLLLQVSQESTKPVLCREIQPGASVRVVLPHGITTERNRYPFSAILDVLGPSPHAQDGSEHSPAGYLAELVKAARRVRRQLSAHRLAQQCQEDVDYTLGDLCQLVGVSSRALETRLAVAKLVHQHLLLFSQQVTVLGGEGLALYRLAPMWQEGILRPEQRELPDQNEILRLLECYIGMPPHLYRRSVNPETGDVSLLFHFPEPAHREYGEAIAAAAAEAGVSITIAPQAHQGELGNAARRALPEEVIANGAPSLYQEQHLLVLHCTGQTTQEAIEQAQARFAEETGWQLRLSGLLLSATGEEQVQEVSMPSLDQQRSEPHLAQHSPLAQQDALTTAQEVLLPLADCYRVGVEPLTTTLLVRFHFPDVARQRYATLLAQLEAHTGWQVKIHPGVHQGALLDLARHVVPDGLICTASPSLYVDRQLVCLTCQGQADKQVLDEAMHHFEEQTSWHLEFQVPSLKQKGPRDSTQAEVQKRAQDLFQGVRDLYRISVESDQTRLVLRFYFPDVAQRRYGEQMRQLAEETGWQVEVYPQVHQKALIEAAQRLLPETVTSQDKSALYQDRKTLQLTCIGEMTRETLQEIQRRFLEETGWSLVFLLSMENA